MMRITGIIKGRKAHYQLIAWNAMELEQLVRLLQVIALAPSQLISHQVPSQRGRSPSLLAMRLERWLRTALRCSSSRMRPPSAP